MLSYELLTNPNSNVVSDTLSSLANAALGAYCGAFQNYLNLAPGFGSVPGLAQLASEVHRHACSKVNPPIPLPPPTWNPNTGQCAIDYNVTLTYQQSQCYNGLCFASPPPPSDSTITKIRGPIKGLGIKDGYMGVFHGEGQFTPNFFPGPSLAWFRLKSVVPWAGGPDNCGNHPPSLPTYPPGGWNFPPVNIPFVPPGSPPALPPINIPVFPLPVIITPQINFMPTINLDVGGINFTFDARGWNVSVPIDVDITIPINPTTDPNNNPPHRRLPPPPPSDPNTLPPGSGGANCDLKPVLDQIAIVKTTADTIKKNTEDILKCPCESMEGLTAVGLDTNIAGGVYDLASSVKGIKIVVKGKTNSRHEQSGLGGKDLLHCGWFAFRYDHGYGQRYYVNFDTTTLRCKPGVKGLTVTVYSGQKCDLFVLVDS